MSIIDDIRQIYMERDALSNVLAELGASKLVPTIIARIGEIDVELADIRNAVSRGVVEVPAAPAGPIIDGGPAPRLDFKVEREIVSSAPFNDRRTRGPL